MIICPFIINLIQIWIQDNFLKKEIIIRPVIFNIDSQNEYNVDYIQHNNDDSNN